jgi:branched-chain amino acid transport system permease protein
MSLEAVPAILASGLVLGSLYALMAAGLSLVWSTLGIFNFAHGVFMTLGAYLAWQVGDQAGFGYGAAAGMAIAVAALGGVGCLAERLLIRPFLGRENLVMIAVITTLAALTFLENATLLILGAQAEGASCAGTGNGPPCRSDDVGASGDHRRARPAVPSLALDVSEIFAARRRDPRRRPES